MKKSLIALAVGASLLSGLVHAEEGDWVVRLRATNVNPSESSNLGHQTDKVYPAGYLDPLLPGNTPTIQTSSTLYGSAGADLKVDSNTIPELDISYYFTKNLAAELILALGTKHDVSISPGNGAVNKNLGEVNLLPPTLTLQWHFNPDQLIDPYVGAGVSYVRAMDNGLTAKVPALDSAFPIRIEKNMWGPAIQAGFDVNLQDKWLVNFDVKKIWFNTDVKVNLGDGYKKIDNLDIDPWVISVGFGKKF